MCRNVGDDIRLEEGIMGSYIHTIPSYHEYFDSNAADSTDDGQTLLKTEKGQTVSTTNMDVTQSCLPINESLGRSKSIYDFPRELRIHIQNL